MVEKGEADTARLFIHCSLAHHETLMPLAAKLSPASDVFFDLPGHGRSAAWAGTDYHSDATAIAQGNRNGAMAAMVGTEGKYHGKSIGF